MGQEAQDRCDINPPWPCVAGPSDAVIEADRRRLHVGRDDQILPMGAESMRDQTMCQKTKGELL
jgi:hypothetical protein